jgi:cell division initiation protein
MLNGDDLAQPADGRRLPMPERTLGVTPLDLRQTRFQSAIRGFDRTEVTNFLMEAAESYEEAVRENERLRQEVARLEAMLRQYRQLESTLNTTLVSAQKVAEDMRANAAEESARIVREAEGRAELITLGAQAHIEDVQREIDGLKLKRREAEMNLESMISALHSTLDFVREQRRESVSVPHRSPIEAA